MCRFSMRCLAMPSLGYAKQSRTLPHLCNTIQRCATLCLCVASLSLTLLCLCRAFIAIPGTALPLPGAALVRSGLLCLCLVVHWCGLICPCFALPYSALLSFRIGLLCPGIAVHRTAAIHLAFAVLSSTTRRDSFALHHAAWLDYAFAKRCVG